MHLLTPWVSFDNLNLELVHIKTKQMPGRDIPLVTNEVYHIINRGIASQPVFLTKRDYQRALDTFFYYQNQNPFLRYSFFLRLPNQQKAEILDRLQKENEFLIEIIAYCLMPNHVHFLLRQLKSNGLSIFMSNFSNSYTRYFNTKQKRIGPLLQGKFKAIRIETDEQLLHLSRYIHINPYSSFVVKNLTDLENYPYSSLPEYLNPQTFPRCNKEVVLAHFKNISAYKKFILDQVDYQRRLEEIKHLALE